MSNLTTHVRCLRVFVACICMCFAAAAETREPLVPHPAPPPENAAAAPEPAGGSVPAPYSAQPVTPPASGAAPVFQETQPPDLIKVAPVLPERDTPLERDPLIEEKLRQINAELERQNAAAPGVPPDEAPADGYVMNGAQMLQTAAALCGVLALVFLLAWLARRMGKRHALFAAPHLAQVLGKVYLAPRASLHFVQAGGRVLVVGLSQNQMTAIAEFGAEEFHAAREAAPGASSTARGDGGDAASFLAQFKASLERMERPLEPSLTDGAEIASLQRDVERLQKYLRESTGGEKD